MPRGSKKRVWRDLIEPIKPRVIKKPPPPPEPEEEEKPEKPPSMFDDSDDEEEEEGKRVFIYDKPPKPPQKCGLQPCIVCTPRFVCQTCCKPCVIYEMSPMEHHRMGYVVGHRNGLGPCGPCPGVSCGYKKRCFRTVMCRVPCCKPPRQRCYKTPRVWPEFSTDKKEMRLCYI